LRSGSVTANTETGFARWRAADPSHDAQYKKREMAWELVGKLAKDPQIEAIISEEDEVPRSRGKHGAWAWATAAAVGAIAIAGGFLAVREHPVDYETRVGEQRTVTLADRSRITLNTATRARVLYEESRRVVELDSGEATFDVAHDPTRPFEVHSRNTIARALGTQFNVLSSASAVTVSVLSGRVEVTSPTDSAHHTILRGGQAVTYQNRTLSEVRPANLAQIEAWHTKRVHFTNVTLDQALAEFNRYTPVPLTIGDPSVATLRISGVFRAGESQALLDTLEPAFALRSERRGNTIVLLKADPIPGPAQASTSGR
jgi:transmembrane sensor